MIEDDDIQTDRVSLGSRVVLQNVETNKEISFTIVASAETNPKERKISDESPVGRAIIGKPIDSEVEVQVPAGIARYRIVSIDK